MDSLKIRHEARNVYSYLESRWGKDLPDGAQKDRLTSRVEDLREETQYSVHIVRREMSVADLAERVCTSDILCTRSCQASHAAVLPSHLVCSQATPTTACHSFGLTDVKDSVGREARTDPPAHHPRYWCLSIALWVHA